MIGVREMTSSKPAWVPRPQEYCSGSPPDAVKAVKLKPMLEALVHTVGSWNLPCSMGTLKHRTAARLG